VSTAKARRAEVSRALLDQQRQSAGLAVRLYAALAGRVGVNITDVNVLSLLDKDGPMTAGQVAQHVGLSRGGAITAVIDRLERAGFLRRRRDPTDRRRVIVELVADGPYRALTEALSEFSARYEALIERYTDEQLDLLLDFAGQAGEIVEEYAARLQSGARERS
jgi:DNA-binding MarR family transcriptional regulator